MSATYFWPNIRAQHLLKVSIIHSDCLRAQRHRFNFLFHLKTLIAREIEKLLWLRVFFSVFRSLHQRVQLSTGEQSSIWFMAMVNIRKATTVYRLIHDTPYQSQSRETLIAFNESQWNVPWLAPVRRDMHGDMLPRSLYLRWEFFSNASSFAPSERRIFEQSTNWLETMIKCHFDWNTIHHN